VAGLVLQHVRTEGMHRRKRCLLPRGQGVDGRMCCSGGRGVRAQQPGSLSDLRIVMRVQKEPRTVGRRTGMCDRGDRGMRESAGVGGVAQRRLATGGSWWQIPSSAGCVSGVRRARWP
jgi:hypothetical protein